jgi:hypothetical protein
MTKHLSAAAYAERRGVSHVAVLKAINEGRIKAKKVGRSYRIDPDVADAQWDASTNVDHHSSSRSQSQPAQDAGIKGPSYNQSRSIKEAYAAKLKKLEYEEAIGKLVSAEAVNLDFANVATLLRQKLRSIPDRISAQVHACKSAAEVRRMIAEEVDIALTALSEGLVRDTDE